MKVLISIGARIMVKLFAVEPSGDRRDMEEALLQIMTGCQPQIEAHRGDTGALEAIMLSWPMPGTAAPPAEPPPDMTEEDRELLARVRSSRHRQVLRFLQGEARHGGA